MGEAIAKALSGVLGKELAVFIVAMIPIVELRGAIPIGAAFSMPMPLTFILAYIGNLLPVPFILLFIRKILSFMKRFKCFEKIVSWVENKAMKTAEKRENLTFWGLVIFVGIPLPGTGAWTGALLADFLGVKFWKAMLAIALGVLLAGIIMMIVSYGIAGVIGFLG